MAPAANGAAIRASVVPLPMASAKLRPGETAIVPEPSYTGEVLIVSSRVAVEIRITKIRELSASETRALSLP